MFPASGGRLNMTDRWLGYTFYQDHDELFGWYGFVKSKSELVRRRDGAGLRQIEFVINYGGNRKIPASSVDGFPAVKFNTERDWYYRDGWVVEIQEDWDGILKWSAALAPVIEAIDQLSSNTAVAY